MTMLEISAPLQWKQYERGGAELSEYSYIEAVQCGGQRALGCRAEDSGAVRSGAERGGA